MNIQPMRITWVRSAEAREKLVAHGRGNQAKTFAAPNVAARKAMFDRNDELRAVMGTNNGHRQAAYFIMAVRAVGLPAGLCPGPPK